MTEVNGEMFRQEGEPAFQDEPEKENSTDSPTDETKTEKTPSPEGGENNQEDPDKDKPFHEHPRWKQREEEWNKRFNEAEVRHQDELKKIEESVGLIKKEVTTDTKTTPKMPSWFGGTEEQYAAYLADRKAELDAVKEEAKKDILNAKTAEEKNVAEATAFMQTELAAIEADPELNPDGSKLDPNKLLKFVLDNDLVDSKGRWNYRAGFKLMNANKTPAVPPKTNQDRKKVADATTKDNKAETKPPTYATSETFKKERPW